MVTRAGTTLLSCVSFQRVRELGDRVLRTVASVVFGAFSQILINGLPVVRHTHRKEASDFGTFLKR